ncbi:hypothetical protein KHQ06_08060 [Nocardia tengchongensis]|uniref:Uncharacterized protein n=1 Tax=Nocardia tengchongensis TaxID=2055889 RepID=A0ABX8CU87_9NOCA|nr:hypothetical protein [Nocardia tengchongensis]QVI22906.1 hypothetical protein KHQ06_08060 [Nocardia tengchongensis]
MHREHEALMRSEFHDRTILQWQADRPGISSGEQRRLHRHITQYDQRWAAGPHATDWQFLTDALREWQDRPDEMDVYLAGLDYQRRAFGRLDQVSETQWQSLVQAHNIAHEDRIRQRYEHAERDLGIDRWR